MSQSQRAQEILTEEVRDVAGDEAAERASERLAAGEATPQADRTLGAAFASNRLLLTISFALALMLGVIAALALETWWVLAAPLLVHAALSTVVVTMALRLTTDVEKPGPQAQAELEEEGVADPEGSLNELLEAVADEEPGSRSERAAVDDAGETEPAEEDPAGSALKQQAASTPASEQTNTAGG